jgi:hypothetical protein
LRTENPPQLGTQTSHQWLLLVLQQQPHIERRVYLFWLDAYTSKKWLKISTFYEGVVAGEKQF